MTDQTLLQLADQLSKAASLLCEGKSITTSAVDVLMFAKSEYDLYRKEMSKTKNPQEVTSIALMPET